MAGTQIGSRNRLVTIQRRAGSTPNSAGDPVEAWEEVATTWARVTPLRGAETFADDEHTSRSDVRFNIRFRAGLDARMRVIHAGQAYDIDAISEPTVGRELEIDAHAHAPTTGVA